MAIKIFRREKSYTKMVRIDQIVFFHTPFHEKAFYEVTRITNLDTTLIVASYYINLIKSPPHYYVLENKGFSRLRFLESPLKQLPEIRKKLALTDQEIIELGLKYDFCDGLKIYLGNDKDIFVQRLLYLMNSKIKEVIAIDEGLGFYLADSLKDRVFKKLYPLISQLILGRKIYYLKRLGTHPMVNKVFLREPELLLSKQKGITYERIFLSPKHEKRIPEKGKALIYSFPEQDLTVKKERKLYVIDQMVNFFTQNGIQVVIKPHPRENISDLEKTYANNKNVELLKGSLLGEELDYFNFEVIINFFSSVILDILNTEYPAKRLITIGFTKKPLIEMNRNAHYIFIDEFDLKRLSHSYENYN
ncbi:hypothetical protein LVD13_11660 [Flavobacteriaceae bacterium D16]|nr:hypothetical protein [Flavobacteriaceae bacterium D16]